MVVLKIKAVLLVGLVLTSCTGYRTAKMETQTRVQRDTTCKIGYLMPFSYETDTSFATGKKWVDFDSFPSLNLEMDSMDIRIYNRWGVELFHASDTNKVWMRKDACPDSISSGTYFYVVQYRESPDSTMKQYSSSITIIR